MKSKLVFMIILNVGTLTLSSNSVGVCEKTVRRPKDEIVNGVKRRIFVLQKKPDCCEGYTLVQEKCIPLCNDLCINSICTSPNKCSCKMGYERKDANRCIPTCDNCENGYCSEPGFCRCHSGYVKDPSTDECTSSTLYNLSSVFPNLSSTSLPTTHEPPVEDTPIVPGISETTSESQLESKIIPQSTDNQGFYSYQSSTTQSDLNFTSTPIDYLGYLVTILSQDTTTTDESWDISTETTLQPSATTAQVESTESSKEASHPDIDVGSTTEPLKDTNNGTDSPNHSAEKQDISSSCITIAFYVLYLLLAVMGIALIIFTICVLCMGFGSKEYNVAQLEKKKGVAKYLVERDELTTIWG